MLLTCMVELEGCCCSYCKLSELGERDKNEDESRVLYRAPEYIYFKKQRAEDIEIAPLITLEF